MKRAVHAFATVLVAAIALMATTESVPAQPVPQIRLTPLQRQQFARDLVPSDAQNFFTTGHAALEQEIRRLARPRSPLREKLLTIRQEAQMPPSNSFEKTEPLPSDQVK